MTSQKNFVLILVVNALLCAGIAVTVINLRPFAMDQEELTRAAEQAAKNQKALLDQVNVLRERVQRLEAENARLAAEAAAGAREPRAEPASPAPEASAPPGRSQGTMPPVPHELFQDLSGFLEATHAGGGSATVITGKPSAAMTQFIRNAMQVAAGQESRERSTELASRLGLDDAQRERVAARLREKSEAMAGAMEALLTADGAASPEDAKILSEGSRESAEWFADIFTPEQVVAYEKWQAAERKSAGEARALRRLADFQNALPDLNQDQKDRLYQHFLTQAESSPGLHAGAAAGAEIFDLINGGGAADEKVLSEILTPSQAEAWKISRPADPEGLPPGGRAIIRTIRVTADP